MCDKRRLNTVSESEENPGPSHSRSGGNSRPQFSFPRIFSEPVFRVSRRADFHIENFKWRTRKIGKYQRGPLIPGSDRFAGAAFRATNQACEDPDTEDVGRDLELVFGQDEAAVVYKPTTTPVDLSTPLGTDDTMSRYREEMSESDPLRGNDEWSGVGEQARSNIWKRHATTLAWAIFLGALAVSVLILAAVLAIVLEYNNSSVAMNSTVNGTGVVTRTPIKLNTTGGKLKSPEAPSPAMLMLTKSKSSKYERISGKKTVDSSSTAADPDDDFTRLTARSKWPLTDTMEKATSDFKRELKLGAAGPVKVIDVTSKPIIVPIPLLLSTAVGSEIVQQAVTFAEGEVQKRHELEAALSAQGYTPKSGNPGSVYTVSTRWTSPEAANRSTAGFLMDRASQRIMQLANLTKEEVQKGIPTASEVPNQFCDTSYLLSIQCDTADVYRSHDGTCNNLEHVRWGSSFQSFRRILYPDYADGISEPRAAQNGAVLPSPRSVTTKVFMEDFVGEHIEKVASYMFVLWAQFINHDIAFAPSSTGVNETAIPCCVNGKLLPTQHPECLPIAIDASDSFYANFSQQCINFVRSAPAPVCEFDTTEKATSDFKRELKLGAAGPVKVIDVTSKPIIVPIPLLLSTAVGSEIVQQAVTFAEGEVQKRHELEAALSAQGYTPKSGNPGSVYTVSTRWTSPEAANRSTAGFLMDRASQRIMQLANLTKEEVQKGIPTASGVVVPNQFCDTSYLLSIQCDTADVYRSHDGTCNNLEHVRWGSSFQSFRRILYPDYADGISEPRAAQNGAVLPSPRTVTTKVFMEDFVGEHIEKVASYMFVLWAQFINHDIAFAPSSTGVNETAIPCCVNGKLLPTQHPECLPIAIDASDSFYANFSQQCINFVRSAPAPVCEFGPREQMNQVTSYIDGSMLYGSTEIEFTKVLGYNPPLAPGRLPQTVLDDGRTLPERSTDLNDGCNIDEVVGDRKFCFKTGDRRINEYTGLTIMETIWTRHHNLIAAHLNAINPHWSDKIVFEESRRVVIAQIQHITYNEFLPVLLGPSLCQVVGLKLEETGYYGGYDPETNPTISDAFEAAAFRMGHSMMQGLIKMIGPRGKNEDFIQIHKLMYNPFRVYDVGRMENLIRGHAVMPAGKADLHVSNQVMQHVFQLRNNSFGMDLPAMDIQRGRDHGIPGYLQWRRICNLTSLNTYETISTIWQDGATDRVSQVYGNIEDVDLYTGGLAETAIPGGVVGPTFACILADQFLRLRKGDRFWYENSVQMKPFTPDQLALIRKTTLAQVLCQSSDSLDELQLRVMVQPTSSNPLQPCGLGLLSRLDFAPWKDFTTLTNMLSAAPTEDIEDYADEEDRVDKEVAKDLANEGRNGTDDEPIIIDFSKVSPKKFKSGAKSSANGKQGDAASPS